MTHELSIPEVESRRVEHESDLELSQWFWVGIEDEHERGADNDRGEAFCCVVHIGSNYAELQSPRGYYYRVHFDKFFGQCRFEPNPEVIIGGKIEHHRGQVRQLTQKVRELTARLGVGTRQSLSAPAEAGTSETRALSVALGRDAHDSYKNQLIKAKDETLPELFESIKEANEKMARWMTAETLPLQSQLGEMRGVVSSIEDRIFSVGLYAGLTEDAARVREGAPAALDAKLHVMQRMAYMDEECIAAYRVGGMEFNNIGKFDKWLGQRENFTRLLPHERCCIAFRVRRNAKQREWDGTIAGIFINLDLGKLDKRTFLYVRNGEQLWRIDTDIQFGSRLFPDHDEFDLGQAMYARMSGDKVETLITEGHYLELVAREEERQRKSKAWRKANPKAHSFDNPHERHYDSFRESQYVPYTQESVYYDDIQETIAQRVKDYNQICLILQGLFDRSEVLHPHPPYRLWTPDGFEAGVVLVRDSDMALENGEAPDFAAYTARCNLALGDGCVTFGQQDFWLRAEAVKERDRCARSWRERSWHGEHFHPFGNHGPGEIARVESWSAKKQEATYRWTRKRQRYSWRNPDERVPCKIAVPAAKLFNIDAYQPGDFRQFYADHRTRAAYLKWAHILLTAEEYHAGNLKLEDGHLVRKPKPKRRKKKD